MKAVLYSVDIGGYDHEWPVVPQSIDTHVVRFGPGDKHLAPVSPDFPDRLVARWWKCHPDVLFPDADFTVWVDACLEITSPTFVEEVAAQARSTGMGYLRHPDRDNMRDEVVAAAPMIKYPGNRHAEMVAEYERVIGGPVAGLWAMTMIARWLAPPVPRLVDHLVWTETLAWSDRRCCAMDQIILPFVFSALDVWPDDLDAPVGGVQGDGTLWKNDWFVRHPHKRET